MVDIRAALKPAISSPPMVNARMTVRSAATAAA